MTFRRFLLPALMLFPLLAQAESKEMLALQRDVAQLQEQMRLIQQTLDTKLTEISVLARQASEGTNRNQITMADLQKGIQAGTADLGKQVAQPIAAMNSRIDGLSTDMQAIQNAVADQNAKMAKLQQQLADLLTAVKTMQAPPPPPPTTDGGTGAPSAQGAAGPPASASVLWANAKRDMDGGNADLALQEFADYVKWYRDNDLAPTAQYNIGNIHFFQKKYDEAVQDFDQVLETFPNNDKTADAHYMKGRSLVALGQRSEAAKEFRVCATQFKTSLVAPKCTQSLAALPPAAAPRRK